MFDVEPALSIAFHCPPHYQFPALFSAHHFELDLNWQFILNTLLKYVYQASEMLTMAFLVKLHIELRLV